MKTGTLTTWYPAKGYGFISQDGEKWPVFVLTEDFAAGPGAEITEGMRVKFEVFLDHERAVVHARNVQPEGSGK